ncbi:ABC transporter substrate-binding protein [Clostridium sp. 19966]|uniref:ABC transporter substrate-binding protein n=1 Tax=Clostridium sp. 19966 TaxID=2768166 RepID=UPI0028E05DF1|nr:ABC transporter substrate-binding protein [Clostridium sp. 19966]MDT8715873.1 ABC transporter substrate-binding protein [Clostridium sp. 19966]
MIKKVGVIVLSVLVASSIFVGCKSKHQATNGGKSTVKTLVYAQGSDPRGLDPAYVDDGESAKVTGNIYEGLVKYKADSTDIEPSLATSWKISEDGKTYDFILRKGVKFQDGTDFNADAVKYNIERQLPPKATDDMPYASFCFGEVDHVEKVNNYEIKIILKEASTPFLANLAMTLAAPIVSPTAAQKYNGNLNEHPVGTGPFKFVKWEKAQDIQLERNDNYWGTKAKVDKVVFKFIKENSVRASELIAGTSDIIDGIDASDIKKLEDNKLKIFNEPGMNINYMAFNTSRAPFNDPKLREAISHAINKEEMVKSLYQGYASVAETTMPSFIPGYDSTAKSYGYDVDKAKQLLKDEGKENLSIKILAYSNPRPYNAAAQKLAESIQSYLEKVGVKATIDTYPWTEYKQKAAQGEGDIMLYGWIGDNGDADNFLSLFDSSQIQSTLNVAKYSNPQVDELLKKGRVTPNGDARNEIYKQVQQLVLKDAAWLPISHAQSLAAYSPKVKNFKIHSTGSVFLAGVDKD